MSPGAAQRATVRLAARAKINLRLQVLAREVSGYHQIETVFCALDFADDVEIVLGGEGIRLEIESADGIEVPGGPENLVYRAAERFFTLANVPPRSTIRLKKRIPVGAGLGGGSSDAASTLKGLDLLCRTQLGNDRLAVIGNELGADVPFFLCGSSFALAWGRGQRLLPLQPLPVLPVLLVVPPFAIETRAAYQGLAAPDATPARILPPLQMQGWEAMQEDAFNDFEASLFPQHPRLAEIRDALLAAGASTALLSGSGSTIFGLFPLAAAVARAARKLRERWPDLRTIETQTVDWSAHS